MEGSRGEGEIDCGDVRENASDQRLSRQTHHSESPPFAHLLRQSQTLLTTSIASWETL